MGKVKSIRNNNIKHKDRTDINNTYVPPPPSPPSPLSPSRIAVAVAVAIKMILKRKSISRSTVNRNVTLSVSNEVSEDAVNNKNSRMGIISLYYIQQYNTNKSPTTKFKT